MKENKRCFYIAMASVLVAFAACSCAKKAQVRECRPSDLDVAEPVAAPAGGEKSQEKSFEACFWARANATTMMYACGSNTVMVTSCLNARSPEDVASQLAAIVPGKPPMKKTVVQVAGKTSEAFEFVKTSSMSSTQGLLLPIPEPSGTYRALICYHDLPVDADAIARSVGLPNPPARKEPAEGAPPQPWPVGSELPGAGWCSSALEHLAIHGMPRGMQSRAQVRLFGHDVVVPPNTDVWNLSNSHKMGLQKKALFWLTWEPVFSKQGFEMVAFEEEQSLKGSATTVEKDEVACRILDEASVCIRLRVRHDPDERTTYLLGMRTSQDAKVALSCGFSEADEASRATCKTIFEIQEHPEAGRELLQEP